MSDETGSVAASEPASLPADAPDTFNSVSEATSYLNKLREKRESPAESADAATADNELPDEGDTATPETDSGESTEQIPEAPAIEPPNSWTKAEKERFASLPRETQEYLHTRELERERAFSRSQNEIAEQRKAMEAEREQAKQVRQQFESKLTTTVKFMEDALQAEFGEIQTMNDVRKLQAEDPFRFQAWQVRQMELTTAKSEHLAVEQRQAQEKQSKRSSYEAEQNKLLVELVPEMADPKKASELRERAVAMLTDDLGLKTEQLQRWMQDDIGHEILSNAGIQKLIADRLTLKEIKAAPKAVVKPDLPPVQRPGTARATGSANSERIQALTKELNSSGSLKAAQELRALQMRSRAS